MAAPQARLYTHPHGRALGSFWMGQTLHLNKIKLANAFVEGTVRIIFYLKFKMVLMW